MRHGEGNNRIVAFVGAVMLTGGLMQAQPEPSAASAGAALADGERVEKHTNRLAKESSPYLLQHAHNPVDWYAWGAEAFEEARRRQVPIFLSIGYSTCYWCHVMERESFENEEIAALMNSNFVCIKVDREERPDVDDIYMAATQLITRRGGWPMSVWLVPASADGDVKVGAGEEGQVGLLPFYAGTYFPAVSRGGMAAFPEVLRSISEAWKNQREEVIGQSHRVTAAVREQLADRRQGAVALGEKEITGAIASLLGMYDKVEGGFGRAPKFPQPVYLEFLLEVAPSIEDSAVAGLAKRAMRHTLDRMALGGMNDQVGGGFHRYSVDEKWLTPHFEKMLYDNAQLASLYARSFVASGDPFDAEVVRRTLDYVLREMTDAGGGFHSAQDAEVNHHEGENYLWNRAEMALALGEEEEAFASRVYGLEGGANFSDPHAPELPARNILFLAERPEETAKKMGMTAGAFGARLARVNAALYEARKRRDQPRLDDKVIVSWNGLMIAALAEGAVALKEPRYLEAAERAAAFIVGRMRDPKDGGLLRVWRKGQAKTAGVLEDYAGLARGLLAIQRARLSLGLGPGDHLAEAGRLVVEAEGLFGDGSGALYDTLPGRSDLIVRSFSTYDGAVPAGVSVMVNDLIDMYELTGDRGRLERSAGLLGSYSEAIHKAPVGTMNSTRALARLMRHDGALAASIGGGSKRAGGAQEKVVVADSPVKILAAGERVVVKKGEVVTLPIEVRIDKGYHISANKPGLEYLIPFSIRVEGGKGVRLRVEYPPGEVYEGAALAAEDKGKMLVYTGVIRMDIRLERTEEAWKGDDRPLIVVTYQACDDEACFQPMTVELDVSIDPG